RDRDEGALFERPRSTGNADDVVLRDEPGRRHANLVGTGDDAACLVGAVDVGRRAVYAATGVREDGDASAEDRLVVVAPPDRSRDRSRVVLEDVVDPGHVARSHVDEPGAATSELGGVGRVGERVLELYAKRIEAGRQTVDDEAPVVENV